jgi:hypothetical protein
VADVVFGRERNAPVNAPTLWLALRGDGVVDGDASAALKPDNDDGGTDGRSSSALYARSLRR